MAVLLDLRGEPTGSAPLTYTVSELGTVDFQAAFASFDGTSASGDFLPTITVRSQNGTVIARSQPATTVTAGASADVSWFRRLRPQGASAPVGGNYASVLATIAAARNLLGYWKLSEAASPFADTSGNAGGAANAVVQTGTTTMTEQEPGALPAGQDPYGVQFNAANNASGDWLLANNARFQISNTGSFSLSCFVKPLANANTFRGSVLGNYNPAVAGPNNAEGIGLFVDWPALTLRFDRSVQSGASEMFDQVDGPNLATNKWTFVVGTYSQSAATMTLYVNGSAYGSVASSQNAGGGAFACLGRSHADWSSYPAPPTFPRPGTYYGQLDEAGFWGDTLSATEVAALATAAGYS